jgi:hypothetical protein
MFSIARGGVRPHTSDMPSLFRRSFFVASVLVFSCVALRSQQGAAPAATGTVTGVITCGDTQRPARFAGVTLMPVPEDKPPAKRMTQKEMEADPAAAMKMVQSQMGLMTMLQEQTGLDGSYTIANVPPGDYYLSPTVPGYVSSLAAAQAAAPPGATGKKLYAGVPVVHVEVNRTARGDVTLDRGAAVFGTVAFDDGAPAGREVVTLEKVESAKSEDSAGVVVGDMAMMFAGGGTNTAFADDRGRYRLAGIPPGDYTVTVTMQTAAAFSMRNGQMDASGMFQSSPILVYSPGTLHKKEATKVTLGAGEEKGDVNITVNLTGMHSVSGSIGSAVDHHALNAGKVALTDTTDKDFKRTASVDSTGAFTVSYVPPGTYTLEVSGGADTEPAKKKATAAFVSFASAHTLKSYDSASQQLIVDATDVTDVHVELKESKTVKQDFDLNDLTKE